jgi:hypothetical protein
VVSVRWSDQLSEVDARQPIRSRAQLFTPFLNSLSQNPPADVQMRNNKHRVHDFSHIVILRSTLERSPQQGALRGQQDKIKLFRL